MNLEFSEEQLLLQKSVREFAESEVRPRARENDEMGHFPRDLFTKAAELGLTGVALPESEGGAGFDVAAGADFAGAFLAGGGGAFLFCANAKPAKQIMSKIFFIRSFSPV